MLIYAFDLVTKLNSNVNEYSFIEASVLPFQREKAEVWAFLFTAILSPAQRRNFVRSDEIKRNC